MDQNDAMFGFTQDSYAHQFRKFFSLWVPKFSYGMRVIIPLSTPSFLLPLFPFPPLPSLGSKTPQIQLVSSERCN